MLLLGATGSGKSTLLRSPLGDLGLASDSRVEGTADVHPEPRRGHPTFGYLPQDPINAFLSLDPETEFALREQSLDVPRPRALADARERLTRLGLQGRLNLPFHQLSGGERKRIALHAALVGSPPILLLDEPLNHLDAPWSACLRRDILALVEAHLLLVATHDPEPFLPAARSVVVLRGGTVALHETAEEFIRRRADFPELAPAPSPKPSRPPPANPPLIELEAVRVQVADRLLLRDVSARFGPGIHALTGPNGSGKTTLLRILVGLHPVPPGKIRVAGLDPATSSTAELSRVAAFHPEEPTQMFFAPTLTEELSFAPSNHGVEACELNSRLREASSEFAIGTLLDRHPWSLSGGERERAALACLDVARTPILLLDEPTHGLDAQGRRLLRAFLERARADGRCILLATHDEDLTAVADTLHAIQEEHLQPGRSQPVEAPA